MSQDKLKEILTRRLKLKDPRFKLKRYGPHINGSVISDTFKGKGDHLRQKMIWDALEAEFGPAAIRKIGTLLCYTNMEWDIDVPVKVG